MNNDNEANDANDNGGELYVGLPETERQELLRRRREVQQEIQMLHQERVSSIWFVRGSTKGAHQLQLN